MKAFIADSKIMVTRAHDSLAGLLDKAQEVSETSHQEEMQEKQRIIQLYKDAIAKAEK